MTVRESYADEIDALAQGGRLIVPLTVAMPPGSTIGKGLAFLLSRQGDAVEARLLNMVAIYNAARFRDAATESLLMTAMRRQDFASVRRLRRDSHEPAETCWLHAPGGCLSSM
jgi:protein-L-isoaspartate(D-aspartate) O-methyltransferase